MSGTFVRSANVPCGRSPRALFRRRLTSQGDVKRAQREGRSQNRALMRGGPA